MHPHTAQLFYRESPAQKSFEDSTYCQTRSGAKGFALGVTCASSQAVQPSATRGITVEDDLDNDDYK